MTFYNLLAWNRKKNEGRNNISLGHLFFYEDQCFISIHIIWCSLERYYDVTFWPGRVDLMFQVAYVRCFSDRSLVELFFSLLNQPPAELPTTSIETLIASRHFFYDLHQCRWHVSFFFFSFLRWVVIVKSEKENFLFVAFVSSLEIKWIALQKKKFIKKFITSNFLTRYESQNNFETLSSIERTKFYSSWRNSVKKWFTSVHFRFCFSFYSASIFMLSFYRIILLFTLPNHCWCRVYLRYFPWTATTIIY